MVMTPRRYQKKMAQAAAAPVAANDAPVMRQDDYTSAVLGPGRLMAQFSGIAGVTGLMRYASGGLYARAVDLPADKAVSRGVIIEGDKDGEIAAQFDRLGVLNAFADCLRWSMVVGGGALVLLTDDSDDLAEPLNEDRLTEIVEIRSYPGSDFQPENEKYTDPKSPKFGWPTKYRVTSQGVQFIIHESRIIPVTGGPLPHAATRSNVPWLGREEVSRGYRAICRYETSLDYSENILMRKQQAVYGMKGMADLLKNPAFNGKPNAGEQVIKSRINSVDAVRGVINTVAVDSEDTYTIIDNNLNGIKDVVGEMKSDVSAQFGIPVTIMFGESPGGQNSTGESDFEGWHEKVEGLQKRLQKPLERMVSLIMLQDDVTPLEDWKIVWPPLESPNEQEQAEADAKHAATRKTEVEAVVAAVNAGILSERQAAEILVRLDVYQIEGLNAGASRGAAVDYAEQTA